MKNSTLSLLMSKWFSSCFLHFRLLLLAIISVQVKLNVFHTETRSVQVIASSTGIADFIRFPLILCVSCLSGSLVDKKGKILIPGIYDAVAPVTEEEHKLYDKIDFDLEEYTKDVGAARLLHNTKV